MDRPNIHPAAWVAPGAFVRGDVTIGEQSNIWYNAVLRGDQEKITVGKATTIQDCCVLHGDAGCDVVVGDYVTVGHGAVLHGCTVEDNCLIGMNAVVLDHAVIGAGSIVGAGAVVASGAAVLLPQAARLSSMIAPVSTGMSFFMAMPPQSWMAAIQRSMVLSGVRRVVSSKCTSRPGFTSAPGHSAATSLSVRPSQPPFVAKG